MRYGARGLSAAIREAGPRGCAIGHVGSALRTLTGLGWPSSLGEEQTAGQCKEGHYADPNALLEAPRAESCWVNGGQAPVRAATSGAIDSYTI
jgi:hypothetical protein